MSKSDIQRMQRVCTSSTRSDSESLAYLNRASCMKNSIFFHAQVLRWPSYSFMFPIWSSLERRKVLETGRKTLKFLPTNSKLDRVCSWWKQMRCDTIVNKLLPIICIDPRISLSASRGSNGFSDRSYGSFSVWKSLKKAAISVFLNISLALLLQPRAYMDWCVSMGESGDGE